MESLLTQATVAVELFGFGYVASSFALYAHRRLNQLNQPARWQPRSVSVAKTAAKTMDSEMMTTVTRKRSPVEQLREQCQKAGIKWRDAHGKNKHLKKAEMIAALERLEQTRQKPPQAKPPQAKPPQQPAANRKQVA